MKYGILFISSLFYEYINLEYVRVPVLYRVNLAEYVIRILVAAYQEYVNTYSTRRTPSPNSSFDMIRRSRSRTVRRVDTI